MFNHRLQYFRAAAIAEKAEQVFKLEDDENRVNLASKNAAKARVLAVKALEIYVKSYNGVNYHQEECKNKIPGLTKAMYVNEKSRIQFTKNCLKKFHGISQCFVGGFGQIL